MTITSFNLKKRVIYKIYILYCILNYLHIEKVCLGVIYKITSILVTFIKKISVPKGLIDISQSR